MTTIMKHQKSPSYDQHKLKIVCDQLCDRIDELMEFFDLEYVSGSKMITMSCPIHGGDNPSAINIYPEGDRYRGNWKCRTHNCEKTFKASIIGFVRGIMSNRQKGWSKDGEDTVTFKEALDFALKFLNTDLKSIKINRVQKDKLNFANSVTKLTQTNKHNHSNKVSRTNIVKSLDIPSSYYLNRGYSTNVLIKYDVGDCRKEGKEMSDRVVVPIYDNTHQYMIGCTGRSRFEKCGSCEKFHDNKNQCPEEKDAWKFSKWKHNFGFRAQDCLYNYWFAEKYIMQDNYAIIVESPGNVWKLEENGIHHSVAIFGTNLSDRQKVILDGSGAMSLILLLDNDEAGKKAAANIIQKCNRTYQIHVPTISKADIGDMSTQDIDEQIKTFISRLGLRI